jgi:hypothetical protein
LAYFTNSVKAQTNFVWGKQFGTDKEEGGLNTVTDQSGNVYIAGNTKGVLSGQNYGKTDGFVTKLDSAGNILWTKQFGTEQDDKILDLKIDKTGSLYATGSTKGDLNEKNLGREDIMVVKLDDAGNIVWQKQFGTDSTDIGNAIYVDTQGDIYVAGFTKGILGKSSFGKRDCFILKLDNKGNKLFAYQFGTSGDDACEGMTGDDVSHIYVCGGTAGDLAAKNKGKIDAFVGKFNNKGEQIKLIQFGTDSIEIVNRVVVDKEKNIYAGGATGGDLAGKQQGQADVFLTKINANMDIIWTQQFGTPLWDGINGIDINENISDNIVVSGCQNWPSCQSFIRMYKKDGTLVCVNNYVASGKNGGTCGKEVCLDNKGNIYHTGNTGGNLFNSNQGEHDIFVVKQELDKSQTNH